MRCFLRLRALRVATAIVARCVVQPPSLRLRALREATATVARVLLLPLPPSAWSRWTSRKSPALVALPVHSRATTAAAAQGSACRGPVARTTAAPLCEPSQRAPARRCAAGATYTASKSRAAHRGANARHLVPATMNFDPWSQHLAASSRVSGRVARSKIFTKLFDLNPNV